MISLTIILLLLAIFWLGRTAWRLVAKLLAASENPQPRAGADGAARSIA
ncbi:MAG: hypothetical protein ABI789_04910 [Usitatibacter sp.]